MRKSPLFIALISSLFGGYLCYLSQYDAGAALFGVAVAALTLSPNNSDNSEVQELQARVELLEQQLEHQKEIAQRDIQIALLESRLEILNPESRELSEARIEEERRNFFSESEDITLEDEE